MRIVKNYKVECICKNIFVVPKLEVKKSNGILVGVAKCSKCGKDIGIIISLSRLKK